jgi:hypothetical protein
MFRRDRRNEEQPLRPPVKNNNENNVVEDLGAEEFSYFQEEMHLIQDSHEAMHLTQHDYERSLNTKPHIVNQNKKLWRIITFPI